MMRVEVTEENIADAEVFRKRRNLRSTKCPIALALRELFGQHVSVGPEHCTISSRSISASLPKEAIKFLEDFDDGKPVQPFSFELELP